MGGVDMTSAVKQEMSVIEHVVGTSDDLSLLSATQPAHSTVDHADIRGLVTAVL
jgi:hypothetical protein